MNNAVNVYTRYSPFYLNRGSHPLVPNTLLANGAPKVSNDAVKEALEQMKMALVDIQSIAMHQMKRVVDKKRRTEEYKIGDEWSSPPQICGYIVPICRLKLRHGGLAPFASRRLCHQLHLD